MSDDNIEIGIASFEIKNKQISLFKEGDEPESLVYANEEEKLAINARNLLRHLFRGAPLLDTESSKGVLSFDIVKTLLWESDPALLRKARDEMRQIFKMIWLRAELLRTELYTKPNVAYDFFLNTVLSILPFLEFENGETIIIPEWNSQKNQYQPIQYRFEKLDISPHSGLISKLITDKNRIYACGLVPESDKQDVPSHLLFMGTTYPGSGAALLANLYNFYPGDSVGEHHDIVEVEAWLEKQKKVHVHGHSKGGTMTLSLLALLSLEKFLSIAPKIQTLYGFNPTTLAESTLNKLKKRYEILKSQSIPYPEMNVITQEGDPVFKLGKGLPKETNLFYVSLENKLNGYFSHVHHFCAREKAFLKIGEVSESNDAHQSYLLSDIQLVASYFIFPFYYAQVVVNLAANKLKEQFDSFGPVIEILFISPKIVSSTLSALSIVTGLTSGALFGGVKKLGMFVKNAMSRKQQKAKIEEVVEDDRVCYEKFKSTHHLLNQTIPTSPNSQLQRLPEVSVPSNIPFPVESCKQLAQERTSLRP